MKRENLTEALKNQYTLCFIEERIITLCARCAGHTTLDVTTANQLLEVLLQRETLMEEMQAKTQSAQVENL